MPVPAPPRSSLALLSNVTCDLQVQVDDDTGIPQAVHLGIQKIRPDINDHPLINAVAGHESSGRYAERH